MLTQLSTSNLLQFCFQTNANPIRWGTQRGTCEQALLSAPSSPPWAHALCPSHLSSTLHTHHTHYKNSQVYSFLQVFISLWVATLGKRVYASFVNLSLTRGPSWELRRYFSFPTMTYLVKTEWVVSTLRVIVSSKVKQSMWCSLRPDERVLESVSPMRSQQLPCRHRHHFKGVNEPKTTGSYWEDSLLYHPGKMSGGC